MLKTQELVDDENDTPKRDDDTWTVEVEGTPSKFPWLAKLGMWLAAFCVLLIVLIAVTPMLAPSSMTIGLAENLISRIAGTEVRIAGDHQFRVFPSLELKASRIHQADAEAAATLKIESFEVEASALGALAGSVDIKNLVLREPKFQFTPASAGTNDASASPPDIDRAWGWWRDMTIEKLVIENADIRIRSSEDGHQYALEKFNVSNEQGETSGPLDGIILNGSGVLNGKNVKLRLTTSDPQLLVQGNRWPIDIEVSSELLGGNFKGALAVRERVLGDGKLTLNSADLQALEKWLGPMMSTREPSALTLVGDIGFVDDNIDVKQIELSYGKSSIVGGLSMTGALSSAPTIKGVFSAEFVDFGASRAANAFAFADWPLDGARMPTGNLEISWQRARWQNYDTGRGKLTLERSPKSKRVTANLQDTELYGGTLRATMTLDISEGLRALHTQLKAVGVEMGAFLKSGQGDRTPFLSGRSSLDVNLFSVGGTSKELLEAMTGEGKLIAQSGVLASSDLLTGIFPDVGSSLPYQTMNASFNVSQGIASSEDFLLRAQGLSLVGKGRIDLANWALDMDVGRLGIDGDSKTLQRYRVSGSPSEMQIEAIN